MEYTTTTNRFLKLMVISLLVLTDLKAQENTGFTPSGNLWGLVFGDYAFKVHNDTLQRGGGNVQYKGFNGGSVTSPSSSPSNSSALNSNGAAGSIPANNQENGFAIRRFYLGYDYKFAPGFSASAILANEQNTDASGKNTVYLKYAFLKWANIFKNSDLVLGQYQTCSFASPYGPDPIWSYRAVERTLMDMHNIDASTDLGASLQGKLWVNKKSPDTLNPTFFGYALQIGNNNSAADNASNFKKGRLNIYGTFLRDKLTLGLYGDYLVTNNASDKAATSNTTLKVYGGFKNDRFSIGGEVFQQVNKNSDIYKVSTNGVVEKNGVNDTITGLQFGWTLFGTARIIRNKLNVFFRYDFYNPDTRFKPNDIYSRAYNGILPVSGQLTPAESGTSLPVVSATNYTYTAATFYTQHFITTGLDWTPHGRFHIIPNVWYDGYSSLQTSYTSANGVVTEYGSRVKKDYDLVYRVTFSFIFNSSKKVFANGWND